MKERMGEPMTELKPNLLWTSEAARAHFHDLERQMNARALTFKAQGEAMRKIFDERDHHVAVRALTEKMMEALKPIQDEMMQVITLNTTLFMIPTDQAFLVSK
jgi:hypothetical protein